MQVDPLIKVEKNHCVQDIIDFGSKNKAHIFANWVSG